MLPNVISYYGNCLVTEEKVKIIKGVLEEELQNSIRMKKQYQQALDKLPKGSLVEKKIKGRKYYYLAVRESNRVKFIYKGKISEEEKKKHIEAKELRAKYRKLISGLDKQISFLKKALRRKEMHSLF
jgi:methyltransferase-like protein